MIPFAVFILHRLLDTLTQLHLIKTLRISRATIPWILTCCSALKSFTIENRIDKHSFITLEDAIQTPWVCTGIEKLHVRIEVETVVVPQPGDERWAMWGTRPCQ
ncbi:hypothetical protein BGX30_000454 [Mortierella sp. GBA39]|nr:hypothetical protein BGX30_000454 [Mortierella sp. GBA39]